MVNIGRPSTGCHLCRKRRIKVCNLGRTKTTELIICSAMKQNRSARNASVSARRVQAIEIRTSFTSANNLLASPASRSGIDLSWSEQPAHQQERTAILATFRAQRLILSSHIDHGYLHPDPPLSSWTTRAAMITRNHFTRQHETPGCCVASLSIPTIFRMSL